MLSILPPLLAFSPFSALLLRLTLGLVFITWGREAYTDYKKSKSSKQTTYYLFLGLVGVLLILGFLTQLASLMASLFLGTKLVYKIKSKSFLTDGVNYYLILFIISVSLIFLGAGYCAFDLPL